MNKRIQFEFSLDAAERLQRLKERTHARSYADVIRDSIRFYEWIVELDKDNMNIAAIKDGKPIRVLQLLI